LILVVPLVFCSSVQAELIFTAPPRETAAQGAKDYGPLAAYLSEVLGETVTYKHPGTWARYQRDMRADKFDIVFDGPHFMSWRMKKYGHTPIARLPGKLSFVMIVKSDDKKIDELLDLTYEKICAISPPNLSALTMIAEFGITEPTKLKTVKGGMTSVYEVFEKGECRAVMLRDKFYQARLTDEERAGTKVIFKSEAVANQGITVSTRVNKEMHEKMVISLLEENSGTAPILKRFAPGEDIMIPADSTDYKDYYKLLQGVIVGW
jgi:ABC-type phosphate/phosphonate transport system substrate-binding protein